VAAGCFLQVSSTNKIDRHDINELFVENGIKHHKPKPKPILGVNIFVECAFFII
jgi:hypothetical protein